MATALRRLEKKYPALPLPAQSSGLACGNTTSASPICFLLLLNSHTLICLLFSFKVKCNWIQPQLGNPVSDHCGSDLYTGKDSIYKRCSIRLFQKLLLLLSIKSNPQKLVVSPSSRSLDRKFKPHQKTKEKRKDRNVEGRKGRKKDKPRFGLERWISG